MLHQYILTFIIALLCREYELHSYVNYSLFRGIPTNENQLLFLQNLTERYYVNFWMEPGSINKQVDFVVSPEDRDSLLRDAYLNGVELIPIIENIQEAFDNQTVTDYIRKRTESFDWQNYFKINDIYNWLADLAETHKKNMTVRSIGKTHENRDILVVKIAFGQKYKRSKVFIEGGIHAREWISSAFVTYMIHEIIQSQNSEDETLKALAYSYEWHFVPVLNPDGYEFSHNVDRMWRRNRRKDGAVDLNRNFGHAFCSIGASKNKNTEIYCGPHKFSEPETRAWADYVRSNSKDLKYYIGFHSYGQLMIIPYANSKTHFENFDEVKEMTNKAARRIKKRFNTGYISGTAYDTVGYLTSGVSGCWVKKTLGVPYVVIFELRDQGRYGFALPTNQILPTCLETMDGIKSLLSTAGRAGRDYYIDKGTPKQGKIERVNNCQGRVLLQLRVICVGLIFARILT